LAERLQIQHHSAVELVNRLAARGFVRRDRDGEDRREVLICLTPKAHRVLRELSLHHKSELASAGPALLAALREVMRVRGAQERVGSKRRSADRRSGEDGRAA
jgi:DNA-binding MarR family transcriptional regulator